MMRVTAHSQRGRIAVVRVLLWLIALVAVAAIAWAGIAYRQFTHTPLTVPAAGQTVEIAKGIGFNGIVEQLRDVQVTRAPRVLWQVLAWRLGVVSKLHAGEYALVPGMLPVTLLQNMAAGRVLHHRVTLVDGWTFAQVRQALDRAPKLKHTLDPLSDSDVMAKLGDKGSSPEGEFMPDTYDYVLGMSDFDVLKRAHAVMRTFLAAQWAQRDKTIWPQQPYQALILASLVEKETAAPSELPRIAGVFERRLKMDMRLDTDPSVIYGMGSAYVGKLHKADLETDTPYNTYMRYGLPPTPIALPSRAAVHAVLHPAAGDALYFVAKGDGTHQFSATLAEQNAAVKKYILEKKNQ